MKDLYNKYKNKQLQINNLEVKQFKIEQHIKDNPTDYTSVIANELVKSDIHRERAKLDEYRKRLSVFDIV